MAVIGNNQCFATKFLAVPTLSWTTQAEHNLPTRCETIATAQTAQFCYVYSTELTASLRRTDVVKTDQQLSLMA